MKLFHIATGHETSSRLKQAGVPGHVFPYPEVYHDGPVPEAEGAEWLRIRVRFFEELGFSPKDWLETQKRNDQIFESFSSYDEVVLWFEHDLTDQLLLIRHLDWLRKRSKTNTTISLIQIDSHSDYSDLRGLGDLPPRDLASLMDVRATVRSDQYELASQAWRAFRSPNPLDLERFAAGDTPALPLLGPSLRRHLQEFPSVSNGLSRNQRQILKTVQGGFNEPEVLFPAASNLEEAPYLGDTLFFWHVRGLCRGREPLLQFALEQRSRREPARLKVTPTGTKVLQNELDAIELNGIDRWLGGVHLHSQHGPLWRWDEAGGRLVSDEARNSKPEART